LNVLTVWHRWTWRMKDRSASWTALGMVAYWAVCYWMSILSSTTWISHTLWRDFLLVEVLDYTRFLGCGGWPLQFQILQILGYPASSIVCLLFPWSCIVLWCHRPFFFFFCKILVSVLWMFTSLVYWP
jgi:hypothetical protein